MALDNAVEGCVHESFAALRAVHQARFAAHPSVRHELCAVARDELRHAAWSWRLAAWAEPHLPASERATVSLARRTALSRLHDRVEAPAAHLRRVAGLPDVDRARAIVAALRSASTA